MHRVIALHVLAPPKPALGAVCNGCGVCCASDPCPLGMLVSARLHGACAALTWSDPRGRYVCGVLDRPADGLPRWAPRWARRWTAGWERFARRQISAGSGCDCSLEVQPGPPPGAAVPDRGD